jgi:hypothetical protein
VLLLTCVEESEDTALVASCSLFSGGDLGPFPARKMKNNKKIGDLKTPQWQRVD